MTTSIDEATDDRFLWKIGHAPASDVFSTSATWDYLYPEGTKVDWYESVWIKGRIPKHSFIAWLNARDRLLTRDKLIRWGLSVPSHCLLCSNHAESRQHLFFDCSYSGELWQYFLDKAHLSSPSCFEDKLRWLKNPVRDRNIAQILRLAFQASVYLIWRERNSRLHSAVSKPVSLLLLEVKNILRIHLGHLTQTKDYPSGSHSLDHLVWSVSLMMWYLISVTFSV
ncbi:PREDICTED: uncharacterized protein LOC104743952 [Camelina sativa]|uniref:Uncharacterized protein LOC104743952 n=1 Tax=Camelina sativa TaxID=90675 RepID=A0ABM0VYW4_CAMSA|nr:PREDICTED: uncharacterized protein LOC104743952 [Camelina sativa]